MFGVSKLTPEKLTFQTIFTLMLMHFYSEATINVKFSLISFVARIYKKKSIMDKVENQLKKTHKFRINKLLQRVEFKNRKDKEYKLMNDFDLNSIKRELKNYSINVSKSNLSDILYSDFSKSYNPLKKFFNKLKSIDYDNKKDYITELSNSITTKHDTHFKWLFKKWFVSMVKCMLIPKYINQNVLVLVGKQGCGKTTWLKNLVPSELKSYFYEGSINPNDKDSKLLLAKKFFINMDELTNLNKTTNDAFKQLITMEYISLREAYGRFNKDYTRIASFSATSNNKDILVDKTGNRRYLCNEVLSIDKTKFKNLLQAYHQAYLLSQDSSFKPYFDSSDEKRVGYKNKEFLKTTDEELWINELYEKPSLRDNIERKSATEIVKEIQTKLGVKSAISSVKIGKTMSQLGFDKKGKERKYAVKVKQI